MTSIRFRRLVIVALHLWVLPFVEATPLIESIRVTLVTGDDNLRADSGLNLVVESTDSASWVVVQPIVLPAHIDPASPIPVRFIDHSIHTRTVPVGGLPLDEIRRIGISHVRSDSNDQWKMAGIVAVGITGGGEEYVLYADLELDFYFRRVNLYSTVDRVTDWRSPVIRYRGTSPANPEFDAVNIQVKTGTDDLRRGSRVYVRLYFHDGSFLEIPLTDPGHPTAEWSDREGANISVALMQSYRYSDIRQVRVRMEGEKDGGRDRDDWDLDAIWLDGFIATTPMERAAGMAPNDRRPIAAKAPVQAPGTSHDPGHIRRDEEITIFNDGDLSAPSGLSATQMRVTIATGSDDLRASSEVFVQLAQPDGSFFEHRVTKISPERTEWPGDSTNDVIIDVPLDHRLRRFEGFRVRFRATEFGGSGVDEWTFDGAQIELFDGVRYQTLVSTSLENHHFRESHSQWLGGIGSGSEPLEEGPVITMPEVIQAEIPPIRNLVVLPHLAERVEIEGISYGEWREEFLSSRQAEFDEAGESPDEEGLFARYAFALADGETPKLFITDLGPDPINGEPLFSLVYKRMLNASGVRFRIRAAKDLRAWWDLAPAAEDVHVLPDVVNGVEWCEVIVRGEMAVAGAAQFFVQADPVATP